MKRVLLTGISGFVASHVCEHLLKNTDWEIVGIDKLSYASEGFDRLRDIHAMDDKRVTVFTADLTKSLPVGLVKEIGEIDYILHLAAESHVDKSISHPVEFMQNNIDSTIHLLEYARTLKELKKFIYFSTDEVYGTAPKDVEYEEGARFNTGNPYSASKAAAENICQAYTNTFKLPIVITNTMNIIGERQHFEKFIPKIINSVLDKKVLTIHSNADKTQAGMRHYLHARNIADALVFILEKTTEILDNIDTSKGRFNIVGEVEYDNLALAKKIAEILKKPLTYKMVDFHSSRPGHDLRYALSGKKLAALGWSHPVPFEDSLKKTVEWGLANPKWLGRKDNPIVEAEFEDLGGK